MLIFLRRFFEKIVFSEIGKGNDRAAADRSSGGDGRRAGYKAFGARLPPSPRALSFAAGAGWSQAGCRPMPSINLVRELTDINIYIYINKYYIYCIYKYVLIVHSIYTSYPFVYDAVLYI